MKFKFHEHRLWVSPDRRDWVQGAYSPPDDSLPEQSADCIVFRTSNGVLNALGQAVYYQQGTTNDGAHFIIGEDGGIVQRTTRHHHAAAAALLDQVARALMVIHIAVGYYRH